jgi:hypothetical protein
MRGVLDLDARDENGQSPLMSIHPRHHLAVLLGEHGASALTIHAQQHNMVSGRSPLHFAAWEWVFSQAAERYLPSRDDDPEATAINCTADAARRTPLHHAAVMARPRWVERFLARGGDPTLRDMLLLCIWV